MTSGADSGEVTWPGPPVDAVWPTLASGQPVPAMSLSLSAILIGFHVMHGVLGNFQLPPFIQTLSKDRPNGQGDRLFTLPPNVINVDDFQRFAPRKKHLKPKKLLKRLGQDFDPFWMSAEVPEDLLDTHIKQKVDRTLLEKLPSLKVTALLQALQNKYTSENGTGDFGLDVNNSTASTIVEVVQSWLVHSASCPVYYRWEDLGLLYWPRWVRQGLCSPKDTPLTSLSKPPTATSCSWPPGMHCVPAQAKRLKILRWQCRHNKALNNFNRFRPPVAKTGASSLPLQSAGHMRKRSIASDELADDQRVTNSSQDGSTKSQMILKQFHVGSNGTLGHILRLPEKVSQVNPIVTSLVSTSEINISSQDKVSESSDQSVHHKRTQDRHASAAVEHDNWKTRQQRGRPEEDGNATEDWNKHIWKERKRKLNFKCKWIKIPYPVTDDCYCSC